jgi:hypothetical protein
LASEVGEKLAFEPDGIPPAVKFTVPVKPLSGATEAVKEVPVPAVTVWELGWTLSAKFGGETARVADCNITKQ